MNLIKQVILPLIIKRVKLKYDIFLSHAWEDKDDVARPLAEALLKNGLKIFYDEFTLRVGDNLRRSIDNGLSQSKYGVVILSPNFFNKEWPQKELDGLTSREISSNKVIIPIWHNVTRDDVVRFSPILANKVAVSTDKGIDVVANEIISLFNKKLPRIIDYITTWLTKLHRLLSANQITHQDYINIIEFMTEMPFNHNWERDEIASIIRVQKGIKEKIYYNTSEFSNISFSNGEEARRHQILTAIQLGKNIIHNELGITFIFIPPGTYIHGLINEKPFYFAQTLITESIWSKVINNTLQSSQYPQVNISICDIKNFLRKVNSQVSKSFKFNIPLSVQWQFASFDIQRMQIRESYPFNLKEGKPSAFGLYDLIDKVWQFCRKDKQNYELQGGSYKTYNFDADSLPFPVQCESTMSKSDDYGIRPILEIINN